MSPERNQDSLDEELISDFREKMLKMTWNILYQTAESLSGQLGLCQKDSLGVIPLMMDNLNIGKNNYLLERIISESLLKHIENV